MQEGGGEEGIHAESNTVVEVQVGLACWRRRSTYAQPIRAWVGEPVIHPSDASQLIVEAHQKTSLQRLGICA